MEKARLGFIVLAFVCLFSYLGQRHLSTVLSTTNQHNKTGGESTIRGSNRTNKSRDDLAPPNFAVASQNAVPSPAKPKSRAILGHETPHKQLSAEQLSKAIAPLKEQLAKAENDLRRSLKVPEHVTKTIRSAGRRLDATLWEYFNISNRVEAIQTIVFRMDRTQFTQIMNGKYYGAYSNDCEALGRRSIVYDDISKLGCSQGPTYKVVDMTNLSAANSVMEDIYFWRSPLAAFSDELEQSSGTIPVTYIQVVHDVYLHSNGDFYTGENHILLVRCQRRTQRQNTYITSPIIIDRVFSISQFWGFGYFHFIVEDLPRLAFYLTFLRENKDIKVHVAERNFFTRAFLKELGISEHRLISGSTHARIGFIPAGTDCGMAALTTINALSIFLRAKVAGKVHKGRDTIVLVKRSTKRWFGHHKTILAMLEEAGRTFNLRVQVFGDKPPPTLAATRSMFSRAALVVAPHGAGLSNVVFSKPGTCIVEGLCWSEKKVNLCYKRLAQALGHIYHGVVPKKQCMDTRAEELEPFVYQCLKYTRKVDNVMVES